MFDSFFNWLFRPILNLGPLLGVILISFLLAAFITFIYKITTDQEMMKSMREELKKFQKEMKELKDNPQKMMETQKKAMETNMKYMKHSFKPMIVTLIPLMVIFGWLRSTYDANTVILNLPFGLHFGWLGTYIISSIIFSTVLRKMFKIH